MARRNMAECHVPEKYWSILTPTYTPGCKRMVFSVDYLQCLQNPKVNLVQDTIASLTESDVVTASGASFEADVIILCHGFKAGTFYYPMTGRGGVTPSEHWDVAGGPSCYKGCAMNGFPNFFAIRGPNVSSGHQSLIWFIEATTALILNVAGPLIKGDVDVVEVASKAEQSYVSRVQAACQRGFWGRDCHTFYVTDKGWNHTVYPWTPYWLYFHRFVNKSHWVVTPRAIKEE
ncbi:putative monooxygenase [Escovopsis weberi]|uniref:Putative monooxygenase n=1 Tax=Escovopsis weberi TaxID=150374 RepID=A0A0M8N955_ESCWE|nr:putative monooxygenase [Escovopsis weberi]